MSTRTPLGLLLVALLVLLLLLMAAKETRDDRRARRQSINAPSCVVIVIVIDSRVERRACKGSQGACSSALWRQSCGQTAQLGYDSSRLLGFFGEHR